jgi:hypothetical protein
MYTKKTRRKARESGGGEVWRGALAFAMISPHVPRGISPRHGHVEKTTPTRQVCISSRHNATHAITLQACSRLLSKMPAMLLFRPAEAGFASTASASPPNSMLKLSQMTHSSPFSVAAVQPAALLLHSAPVPAAAPSRRALPEKLASTAQHSPAR